MKRMSVQYPLFISTAPGDRVNMMPPEHIAHEPHGQTTREVH
mgnify:CR=1 FL=1